LIVDAFDFERRKNMNLLCWLFGIQCRAKQTTRSRFTSASRVVTGNPEFDRLPPNTQMLLDDLDLVNIDELTLGQLEEALQALIDGNALLAALRLTYFIRDKLDSHYLLKVVKNDQDRTRLQDLINAQLAAGDAPPAGDLILGTGGGIA
jgi:hypothetical protein